MKTKNVQHVSRHQVEEDINTTLGQMLATGVHLHICDIFQDVQSPLQTNEGFEDMLEVIMEIYIPNSGNSEKIKIINQINRLSKIGHEDLELRFESGFSVDTLVNCVKKSYIHGFSLFSDCPIFTEHFFNNKDLNVKKTKM